MPYSKNNIPKVAKNWTEEEQTKCIAAANSILNNNGKEEEAIFACINAAGKSKKDCEDQKMIIVNRFDNLEGIKLKETPEGFLEGHAIATRTGVFKYIKADGTIQRELRKPEEVFAEDAMDSFKMLPITNNHPEGMVTVENAKELTVGFTGDEIKRLDNYLIPKIKFTEKKTVLDIKNGLKTGLSYGYTVELVEESGIWEGEEYDFIQTKIRGNHLALVTNGRAGDMARVKLDSEDAQISVDSGDNILIETINKVNMKKIKLDDKEFEVAEEVAAKISNLEEQNTQLADKTVELEKQVETLEGERDALKEEAKQDASIDLGAIVRKRIELEKKASEVLKEDASFSELTDRQIKEKVITKFTPDFKADEKSEDYIDARFDALLEIKKEYNLAESMRVTFDSSSNKKEDLSNEALQQKLLQQTNKGA